MLSIKAILRLPFSLSPRSWEACSRPTILSGFEPEWVTPISTTYRGWRVNELPPNGQGLAALSMLNILENFDARRAIQFHGVPSQD